MLAVCYTLISANVIHCASEVATLHGSTAWVIMRWYLPSACCSAGKTLDLPQSASNSIGQHPETGDETKLRTATLDL